MINVCVYMHICAYIYIYIYIYIEREREREIISLTCRGGAAPPGPGRAPAGAAPPRRGGLPGLLYCCLFHLLMLYVMLIMFYEASQV